MAKGLRDGLLVYWCVSVWEGAGWSWWCGAGRLGRRGREGGGVAGWCGDGGKGNDRGGWLWENVKLVEWWWRCWG